MGGVTCFMEATRLVSKRYFAGEELLWPGSRRLLETAMASLAGMRDVYSSVLERRPPESDEEFIRWMADMEKGRHGDPRDERLESAEPLLGTRPDVKAAARSLAEHFVVMARARALDHLGERNAGIRLVEDWMRAEQTPAG